MSRIGGPAGFFKKPRAPDKRAKRAALVAQQDKTYQTLIEASKKGLLPKKSAKLYEKIYAEYLLFEKHMGVKNTNIDSVSAWLQEESKRFAVATLYKRVS